MLNTAYAFKLHLNATTQARVSSAEIGRIKTFVPSGLSVAPVSIPKRNFGYLNQLTVNLITLAPLFGIVYYDCPH